ncbi:MAG: Arm DNA-binding domain-containing protein [Candidatus Arsenophonus phytopathogenicus]
MISNNRDFTQCLPLNKSSPLKTKDKPYRLSDGNGLYLYVPVSGTKVWQMRYHFLGKKRFTLWVKCQI